MSTPLNESAAAGTVLSTGAAATAETQKAGQPGTGGPSPGVATGATVPPGAAGAGKAQPPISDLFKQLNSSPQGLTTQEAQERLARYGPNEPAPVRKTPIILQILQFFANPLVGILLFASLVSAILGDPLNATIIFVIVLLSVALNFFQTYRSEQAAERLKAQVAPTATAMRDGKWVEVPRRELVPGDVVQLSAGDMVPADARLIEGRDLHVQQAALTGESMPVEKEALEVDPDAKSPLDAINAVFLGTSVVSGLATALIVSTGRDTQFGDIATRLATRPPETEFERGTRQFGFLIMRTVLFLVLFVSVVTIAGHKGTPLEALLFAVALAVGLTPEFLPMITTITLTEAAVHMSRQKVIVKNLAAIQNFGSIDILCSDKTGTITSGEMSLDGHLDPTGKSSDKVLLLAYVNSSFETGLKNPLDQAITQHIQNEHRPDLLDQIPEYTKVDEIPFDFERRLLSVVVDKTSGHSAQATPPAVDSTSPAAGPSQAEAPAPEDGGRPPSAHVRLMITKGAPESVLPRCTAYDVDGQSQPMDDEARKKCQATYEGLSSNGYRVLALAHRVVPVQQAYRQTDEHDLTLAGYLTFFDRPLPDAEESLEIMRRDGVQVKILTGDNELVAKHVCTQVGLDGGKVVLGEDIDGLTDPALAHVAEQNSVFARVSPAQKNRIILALKGRSHVVGYMGDGINDAPSLHAADVGISVSSGVDVAKDAADIILLESGLKVLHSGILEGRRAFGNVTKYLMMGTSSNFGNMFSMAAATVFLPYLPMLPIQILLNNFLYDLAQVTIPTDNVDPQFIAKPRRWEISIIRDFMVFIGPISSIYDFLTFGALLWIFHATEEFFHTGWFVESLATQTLVLFVIRTVGNPLRSRPSVPLTITTLLVVLIALVLPFTPIAPLLGFVPLPFEYFVFLFVATITYLLLVQVAKGPIMRRWLAS
jgi:Mg2+-importing ATPase